MKRTIQILSTLLLAISGLLTLEAQQSSYERQPGYWTLGINGGMAYQQSDVPLLLEGYGGGLTLAKNLYYQDGSPIAFDLRGRFLYTRTYGLDHSRSYGIKHNDALNGTTGPDYTTTGNGAGFVFQNNKTDLAELGLEGVITFNRLREQKNILLSLYGGIGLDWYNTHIDQKDGQTLYNTEYAAIDTSNSVSSRRSKLKNNILDGNYETNAHSFKDGGKLRIMPSLGVELGYEFTPRFSMGIGHRVTFARNDILDGQQWKNNQSMTGDNDIHHYTSLHMRWIIEPQAPKEKAPEITITEPFTNPYRSNDPNELVAAKIKHVRSSVDVDARFNGRSVPFIFDRERFTCNVLLRAGRNELVITATNAVGRDQKKVILIFQDVLIDDVPETRRPPKIDLTNPPSNRYTTNEENFVVRATIHDVSNKEDIRFVVDGRSSQKFVFNPSSGSFRADIRLRDGENAIQINAFNEDGRDEERAIIILDDRPTVQRPVVNITRPNSNPYNTDRSRTQIEARIERVERKSDIRYTVNGRTVNSFNFNRETFSANANLQEGRNTVVISATNEAGEDRDEVTIYYEDNYEPPVNIRAPEVDITRPNSYSTTTSSENQRIEANIRHIDRKSQIRFVVNGRTNSNFSFNTSRGKFTADIRLDAGDNSVKIIAENEGGRDEANARITYQKEIVTPSRPPKISFRKPANNSTTSTANTAVEAKILHVNDKRDIKLQLNGSTISNFNYSRSILKATVKLREGQNTITITASNADGRDEARVRVTYKAPVVAEPVPPTVRISQPSNNSTSQQETTNLNARVTNVKDKRKIKLTVNGKGISNFSFNSNSGSLTATIKLSEGPNTIKVKATNDDGQDEASVRITYKPVVVDTPRPPVVTISQPKNNSTTKVEKTKLKARVTNIKDKRNIQLQLNGKSTSSFKYNSKSNQLTATLKLKKGSNTIKIIASNEDGRDEASVKVNYAPVVVVTPKPPTVKITKPRNKSKTTVAKASVLADITNVKDKRNIQLFLNGKSISTFSFNNKTNKLSANLNLKLGANSIKITAKNKDGRDEDQVKVTYEAAQPKPVVTFLSPNKPGQQVDKSPYPLRARIEHVDGSKQIQLLVNGKALSKFKYNSRKKELTASIRMKLGKNTFRIIASNEAGKTTADSYVQHTVKVPTIQPPSISDFAHTAPAVSPLSPNTAKTTVTAKLSNISQKSQITISRNGNAINEFSFDAKSGLFSCQVTLQRGDNKIVLKVQNEKGSDQESVDIEF